MTQENIYTSGFQPSETGLNVLIRGKILASGETPDAMIGRVVQELVGVEDRFGTSVAEQHKFATELGQQLDQRRIVFSTPIMTNAGRDTARPLSACTVPPVDLRGDLTLVKGIIDQYHQEAMGTGFDLSDVTDPVAVLTYLNRVAIIGAESGKEDRPVGNIATIRADHPKIVEFIQSKYNNPGNWKFNISVDTPKKFWDAVEKDALWILTNGDSLLAKDLLHLIAGVAHACADPGIICIDRLNDDNPTPGIGLYKSTAPCAEVGLIPGETCQFGYINLNSFLTSDGKIDVDQLMATSHLLVRALDNALELSIDRYSVRESADVMQAKRKIGVGICGMADLLFSMSIPYDSEEGRKLCRDLVVFINYHTKLASHDLAKTRGSFGAMNLAEGCRYNDKEGFIETKFGKLPDGLITSADWQHLGEQIRESKMMRHCSTVALPPTGRSGLVIDASTGVEPLFSLLKGNQIHPALLVALAETGCDTEPVLQMIRETGSCQQTAIPEHLKNVFKTSTEIDPMSQLLMVAMLGDGVDESISKTINVGETVTIGDVENIFKAAISLRLKGITIYRDGTYQAQPIKLVK